MAANPGAPGIECSRQGAAGHVSESNIGGGEREWAILLLTGMSYMNGPFGISTMFHVEQAHGFYWRFI